MPTIVVVIVLILLFGGAGGGYYVNNAYGAPALGGWLGTVLIIVLILWLIGR